MKRFPVSSFTKRDASDNLVPFVQLKKSENLLIFLLLKNKLIFKVKHRDRSRTAATSKMELFVIIGNGWKPLAIITKHSISDVAEVLDLPLKQLRANKFVMAVSNKDIDSRLAQLVSKNRYRLNSKYIFLSLVNESKS